jgi:hypothetical protein
MNYFLSDELPTFPALLACNGPLRNSRSKRCLARLASPSLKQVLAIRDGLRLHSINTANLLMPVAACDARWLRMSRKSKSSAHGFVWLLA